MAEVETERECRICRGEDEPGRPLFHPCKCSGSIKYTHEDCLVNWLAQSGSSRCELCNHPFRFEPLYQPNTPSALPTKEFISGILALTTKTIKTAARIVLVFAVWLFFLPLGTCWIWYALFMNSPYQLHALIAWREPAGVFADAFYGCLLSAGIVFVILGVSSLRDYVRHFPHDDLPDADHPFDLFVNDDGLDFDHLDDFNSEEGDDHPLDVNQNDQPPQRMDPGAPFAIDFDPASDGDPLGAAGHAGAFADPIESDQEREDEIDEVFDQVDELVRDTYEVLAGGTESDDDIVLAGDLLTEDSEDEGDQLFDNETQNAEANHMFHIGPHDIGEDPYDGSGSDVADEDGRQADDVLNANLDLNLQQNLFQANENVDDDEIAENDGGGDGGPLFGFFELDPDEVPLEEIVGLRGHIRNLFDNAGTVLVTNAVFLGVFTLIPLLIGRLTLRLFHVGSLPKRVGFGPNDTLYRAMLSVLWPGLSEDRVQLSGRQGLNFSTEELSNDSIVSMATRQELDDPIRKMQTLFNHPVSYDKFLIVLLGYGMIAFVAVGYIGVISMLRKRYPRLDSPITRQVARLLRYVATFVKIVVLILFEFGVFPLGCGWWLDICTLEIFGGTLQSRLTFCQGSPWTCTGGHWLMGIIYMVHISLFISLLREILRPELLWFLRNPDDPEFHPFRELVEKPLSRHARRMCISVVIYVPLIIALVYAPAKLCLKLLPHVFPFRSEDFSHFLIDVPFGNLVIGPLIRLLYFGRPGVPLQKLIGTWIKWMSSLLGIAHLVVKDDDGDRNENQPGFPRGGEDIVHIEGLEGGDVGPLQRMFGGYGDDLLDEASIHDGSNNSEDDFSLSDADIADRPILERRKVRTRAVIMIVSAWITLILAESALVAIPTMLGRWMMGWFSLPVRHDLHPFLLGLNVMLMTLRGIARLVKYIKTVDTLTALSLGLPYLYMAGKGLVIISIWLGAIPLAAGILFELVLVPMRVAHNETPYFYLHQDWAIGLLLLKVWMCIAVTGGLGSIWRERVLRAREGDVIGLNQNFTRTMREVVLPVLFSVVTALSVPYSFAKGMLPLLGVTRRISNLVCRYSYLVITCAYCGFKTMRYSVSVLRDLHDSIRDEKYLMGKQLYNFIETPDGQAVTE
eukprot:GFKZ01009064.1.p1 GENE.GFKZ01009064.1~~GFKZ01009064.1.p1  ORF type:complete len:1135 (-),score=143.58 GFKZ01009064.1:1013-4417(-)